MGVGIMGIRDDKGDAGVCDTPLREGLAVGVAGNSECALCGSGTGVARLRCYIRTSTEGNAGAAWRRPYEGTRRADGNDH